jgi:hypothetical protein
MPTMGKQSNISSFPMSLQRMMVMKTSSKSDKNADAEGGWTKKEFLMPTSAGERGDISSSSTPQKLPSSLQAMIARRQGKQQQQQKQEQEQIKLAESLVCITCLTCSGMHNFIQ